MYRSFQISALAEPNKKGICLGGLAQPAAASAASEETHQSV